MFFRNLTLFRFSPATTESFEDIEGKLAECRLKPVGPQEISRKGFVSPFGRGEELLSHQVGDALLLSLGSETRVLPAQVVSDALAEKLDRIRETEGRNPGGRERKRLKDEVLTDLIPKAFVQSGRAAGYVDLADGWCVLDTSSRKSAEGFVTAIREALGSFPAVPVNAESSPRALMTAWIAGEPLPEGFDLGDEVELRDPVEAGAVIKAKRQELNAEEIRDHLKSGKQVFQLALTFEERISFVLGEDLAIRKLKFLETVTEALDQSERDTQRDEIDAVFALMTGELRILLRRLTEVLSISKVEA
jgi:recombination associated protein RdgC